MTTRPFQVGDLVVLRCLHAGSGYHPSIFSIGAFVSTPLGHCLVVLETQKRCEAWEILDDHTQLEPGCGYVLELHT